MSMVFIFIRPKGHFGTGRNEGKLKKTAPRFHTVKPDLSKIVRAAEDAMSGVVYIDDSQVCERFAKKKYGNRPGVEIFVYDPREVSPWDL